MGDGLKVERTAGGASASGTREAFLVGLDEVGLNEVGLVGQVAFDWTAAREEEAIQLLMQTRIQQQSSHYLCC